MSILIKGTTIEDLQRALLMFRGHEIVELLDHGDLIEKEYAIASACSGRIRALPTTEDGEDWIRVKEVRQSLKSVPVVIPAERSEEGSLCGGCDRMYTQDCCYCERVERSEE